MTWQAERTDDNNDEVLTVGGRGPQLLHVGHQGLEAVARGRCCAQEASHQREAGACHRKHRHVTLVCSGQQWSAHDRRQNTTGDITVNINYVFSYMMMLHAGYYMYKGPCVRAHGGQIDNPHHSQQFVICIYI